MSAPASLLDRHSRACSIKETKRAALTLSLFFNLILIVQLERNGKSIKRRNNFILILLVVKMNSWQLMI